MPHIIKHRLDALIAAIESTDALRMETWQCWASNGLAPIQTLKQLHGCGNTACIAGHLALMPEFQQLGGYPSIDTGKPILDLGDGSLQGEHAVAAFLLSEVPKEYLNSSPPEPLLWAIYAIIHGNNGIDEVLGWEPWRSEHAVKALRLLESWDNSGEWPDPVNALSEIYKE